MLNTLNSGTSPAGQFLHAVLPQLEAGATHILAVVGNKVFLHKLLATGEMLSEELNIPVMRVILQATDSLIPQ